MYVERNTEAFSCKYYSSGRARTLSEYVYSQCAFVALGIQHVMRIRHITICGLSTSTIIFHIISQTARFSKKKVIEHQMCVLIFSNSVRNISHSKKNWARYDHKCMLALLVKHRLFFPYFNETWIFSANIWKILKCKISYSGEISPTRCNNCVFLFALALLYMFRVTISPIIRSTMLYMAWCTEPQIVKFHINPYSRSRVVPFRRKDRETWLSQ